MSQWEKPEPLPEDVEIKPGDGGYLFFRAPDHPLATKKGTVAYHRHQMSVILGRWIGPDELIHFKDEDPTNTTSENMELVDRFTLYAMYGTTPRKVWLECDVCGKSFSESPSHVHRRSYCSVECAGLGRRKFNPSREELEDQLNRYPATRVAIFYDVSDKAIAKRARLFGIPPKGRGYWQKGGKNDPPI